MTGGTILLLEDEAPLRRATRRHLERAGYEVREADTVAEARAVLSATDVDLVLCDIDLPGENGLVLAAEVGATHDRTAVVMVTGADSFELADTALELGTYGYVIKPVGANQLRILAANALRRRDLEVAHRRHESELEGLVAARTHSLVRANDDLRLAREEMVRRLAWAAEYKDPETANHLERMSRYAAVLAAKAGLPPHRVELLRLASPMHDIGKIGIPDSVLLKTGPFDDQDRAVMARHPEIGSRILGGSDSELLQLAAVVALTHHERWDGGGYPSGLAGEQIPLEGRIVAIADVWDALTSRRRYKAAMSTDEAVATMAAEAGRQFDPELLALHLSDLHEVEAIRRRWTDAPERVLACVS